MEQKKNGPKKNAARRWSERLKQIGEQKPPKEIMDILNIKEDSKKITLDQAPLKEMDI